MSLTASSHTKPSTPRRFTNSTSRKSRNKSDYRPPVGRARILCDSRRLHVFLGCGLLCFFALLVPTFASGSCVGPQAMFTAVNQSRTYSVDFNCDYGGLGVYSVYGANSYTSLSQDFEVTTSAAKYRFVFSGYGLNSSDYIVTLEAVFGGANSDSFNLYTDTFANGNFTDPFLFSASLPVSLSLSPSTLPSPTVGSSYSQTITASGGTAPYTFSITSGSLPAGLSLSSSGVVSGTPTAGGNYNFTVIATDSAFNSIISAYSFTVNAPTISVSPVSLTAATVASSYSQTISASGGTAPYTFSVTAGALPAGLSLNGSAGTLSGTPTAGGTFNFTISATDSSTGTGPYVGSRAYSLTVNAPTISNSPTTLPAASVGSAYSQAISASGGTAPFTYAVSSGSLPAGIILSSNGLLTGTPTAGGTFIFAVTATDNSTGTGPYSGSRAYLFTVNAPTITINPTTLTAATVATAYSQSVSAISGTATYSYIVTAGALPPGMTLSSNGTLSGTPTAGGTFNFTITATDSSTGTGPYTGSRAYSLIVNVPTITISPTTLPSGAIATSFSQTVAASGGVTPYTYAITSGALPVGLTLSSNGNLTGTPTAAGTFNFTVTATDDSAGTGPYTGSRAYSLAISAPTISISPSSTTLSATGASSYSQTFTASGGTSPYTFVESGALPSGLSWNSSTATISGIPTSAGSFPISITAVDNSTGAGSPFNSTINYTLTVTFGTPVAAPDTDITTENHSVGSSVASNDTGTINSVSVASGPAHGTTSISGLVITYTPATNFHGTDSYTYTATGPGGTSSPATVTITVQELPSASAFTANTLANSPVVISAASSATGGPFTGINLGSAPASGTVQVRGLNVIYVPDPTLTSVTTVSFTFTLSNSAGSSDPITVTITVTPAASAQNRGAPPPNLQKGFSAEGGRA